MFSFRVKFVFNANLLIISCVLPLIDLDDSIIFEFEIFSPCLTCRCSFAFPHKFS